MMMMMIIIAFYLSKYIKQETNSLVHCKQCGLFYLKNVIYRCAFIDELVTQKQNNKKKCILLKSHLTC